MKNYLREKKGGKPQRHLTPWLESRSGKLKAGFLENVNPCLWLFLRKVLIFEAAKYPNIKDNSGELKRKKNETRDHVIDHYLRDILEYDSTFINRIKTAWNRQEFCFLESDLDKLCQAIKSFGSFKNWSTFEKTYALNPLFIEAEQYRDKHFSSLKEEEREIIEAMASCVFSMNLIVINKNIFAGSEKEFDPSEFESLISELRLVVNNSKNHKSFLVILAFLKGIGSFPKMPPFRNGVDYYIRDPYCFFTLFGCMPLLIFDIKKKNYIQNITKYILEQINV